MSAGRGIARVAARGLYDSNCRVAVEVTVADAAGRSSRALAPRGSSIGEFEPAQVEDEAAQPGLAAAAPAVRVVADLVAPALAGVDAADQGEVDRRVNALDPDHARPAVGGNVSIATSMAAAQLGAVQRALPLHDHLREQGGLNPGTRIPLPAVNLIDGGLGPSSNVPHIEFLLFPPADADLGAAVETAIRVRDRVLAQCHARGYEGGGSQQGAISAPLRTCEEGLEIVQEALTGVPEAAGYRPGLDMAASDVLRGDAYQFPWADRPLSPEQLMDRYLSWIDAYGVRYLEDGFAAGQTDWFSRLTAKVPDGVMVAGDDLYASNSARIATGAQQGWANAAVVKPNQAGTVTDTLDAVRTTQANGSSLLVSQRSGENGGAFISSLALAAGAHYIKVGGPSRMDRVAKINELLRAVVPA